MRWTGTLLALRSPRIPFLDSFRITDDSLRTHWMATNTGSARSVRVSEHPEKETLERLASGFAEETLVLAIELRGAFKDFEAQHATQE